MPEKKLHWMQRPENKEKLRQVRLRAAETKRKKKKQTSTPEMTNETKIKEATKILQSAEIDIHYAHGYVRSWLQNFAERKELPVSYVNKRVGSLLRSG